MDSAEFWKVSTLILFYTRNITPEPDIALLHVHDLTSPCPPFYEVSSLITPILCIRKLRLEEVKWFSQIKRQVNSRGGVQTQESPCWPLKGLREKKEIKREKARKIPFLSFYKPSSILSPWFNELVRNLKSAFSKFPALSGTVLQLWGFKQHCGSGVSSLLWWSVCGACDESSPLVLFRPQTWGRGAFGEAGVLRPGTWLSWWHMLRS